MSLVLYEGCPKSFLRDNKNKVFQRYSNFVFKDLCKNSLNIRHPMRFKFEQFSGSLKERGGVFLVCLLSISS